MKRTDLRTILLIGSGPIVIGQACEFDYSGTQACKALKEEGYRVILVNSNPATIMTDPEFADRTYVEPLTVEVLARIIEAERPDALLPTIGGQTGLNLAIDLAESGVLDRFGVELIGAKVDAIKRAEDRDLFKAAIRASASTCRAAASRTRSRKPSASRPSSACRSSSGRRARWAAPAATSPPPTRSSAPTSRGAWRRRRSARS